MLKGVAESNVTEIAKMLEVRKKNDHFTVLVLGTRAGGIFRSPYFYQDVLGFSKQSYLNMSQVEQFGECFNILTENRFSENDLDAILVGSLKDIDIVDADVSLAELIKQEFFDLIISTNIDDLLERAFTHEEMKETYDFNVFIPKVGVVQEVNRVGRRLLCTVIKTFGDLSSRVYNINKRYSCLDDDVKLKDILSSALERDILVIGFDPVWDDGIIRAFPTRGNAFWYVNEEELSEKSLLFKALQGRQGQYITGRQGSYENFMKALHWNLMGGRPLNYELIREFSQQLRFIRSELGQLQHVRRELVALREEIRKLQQSS